MAPIQRTLLRALGSFKDQTSIGLAKVASTRAPDLEVAIVKATSHEEEPIEEKYVQEILHLTSYSRAYVNACVAVLAKRLGKTHNWIVAIKVLMLIHRLLRDGDPTFEQELLLAQRRGVRVLNASDFRDETQSNAWDYSAFIRTYALYLDERLDRSSFFEGKSQLESRSSFRDRRPGSYEDSASQYGDHGSGRDYEDRRRDDSQASQKSTAIKDMKAPELLQKLPSLQRLLERVVACRPTGAAKIHRLVHIALYAVVKESFQIYSDVCDGLTIILDVFFEMDYPSSVKAFEIYSREAKHVDELLAFYSFCKNLGICRSSEYPLVQRISEDLLDTLEDYLRDRSGASSRARRQRSPEPRARRSPERETEAVDEASYEVNGMKALPAPPTESVKPETENSSFHKQDTEADLLNFDQATISSEEHGDRLALALFSGPQTSTNGSSNAFSSPEEQGMNPSNATNNSASQGRSTSEEGGTTGWELALVESASQLSKFNSNTMAGGFDRFLLDSMYDQAVDSRKYSAVAPAGSASSVALPGRSASSFLALPAPVGQVGEDPFAASGNFPPPSFVQMADLRQKQQLLVQEQQLWLQYQREGMQGYNGMIKCYNSPYNTSFQTYAHPYYGSNASFQTHAVPYYRMGSYA